MLPQSRRYYLELIRSPNSSHLKGNSEPGSLLSGVYSQDCYVDSYMTNFSYNGKCPSKESNLVSPLPPPR